MAFNGSGTYVLPGPALQNGDTVSATENNTFRNDIATALNLCFTRDGQSTATANIPFGGYKLTGLAAGSANGDSVRYEQVTSAVAITGGTITGVAISGITDLPVADGGTGASTAADARTNLGLGTISTQAANNVAITGGSISGITDLAVADGGTGASTLTGIVKGNGTSAFTAATAGTDYVKPDTTSNFTAGYTATTYDAGTKSSGTFTPDPANGNFQKAVNGGAFMLAPPSSDCTMILKITNNGSAGAVTTSGFTKVTGSFTTTNTNAFFCYITKCDSSSDLTIKALQ